ncbi:hypothetical protein K431DRAFT_285007 [Polychaeton citri CBS 116435]|uniref:S-adenosyl-L-methionine-dependent methyltransferase n=1 Tax=Polychaeton citri CBS 116435 TaxID=1314669 RepID=A0A9P4UME9_9PEZI|nr:hypothetical protein K431DRAFT_285007 [Polychaeton citri CBS 116435]
MLSFRPALRPLPIISTSSLLLAATFASRPSSQTMPTATSATPGGWHVRRYEPRYQSWPYSDSDFRRMDPSKDSSFYSSPRFVTHIDDAAIVSLSQYYGESLPKQGRVLDFCSSWVSHYPASIESAVDAGDVQITGMGMNKAELDRNQFLNSGRLLVDLNENSDIQAALLESNAIGVDEVDKLDASTCVVSIDYLTRPVEVLRSLRDATKNGGKVHLTISNRCFPTKAMSRWLRVSEDERLMMVGDFLHFAGWKDIEIVELSDGTVETPAPAQEGNAHPGGLQGVFNWFGMGSRDPLWVVRGTKS